MSTCAMTGKKMMVGNTVSHSKRRVKRHFLPNVQKRTLLNPATGRQITLTLSARGLRTLKKWIKEGKKVDLAAL